MSTETGTVRLVPAPWRGFAWHRAAIAFGLTLLALFVFAAAFAAGYAAFHTGRVLPGVDVAGVPLAGLTPSQAVAELRRELPDVSNGSLSVRVGDSERQIPYAAIDRDYDLQQMVDGAMSVGRGGSPIDQVGHQLRTMMSGVSVPLIVSWDAEVLTGQIATIVAAAEITPTDAIIERPDGRYTVTPSVTGQTVDLGQAVAGAMAALSSTSPASVELDLEPTLVEPAITTTQAQAAADRANAVTVEPLEISVAGGNATISQETLNGWVHLTEAGPGQWDVRIDEAPIAQWIGLLKREADVPATNAGYTFEGRDAVVTPAANGTEVDAEAAEAAILAELEARLDTGSGGSGSPIVLAMTTLEPEFSTVQAQALVTQVRRLGQWTTRYTSSASNGFGQNIKRPTRLINGTVVQPGEVFDWVEVAGPITEANGYTGGAAIIHGNTVFDGVLGGGLCSCSTTLFNAALRAGFDINIRRNHAYYIDRYPVGLDATIWINGRYVQTMAFTNDSQYPILIRGVNGNGSVTFQIYGVPDGRRVQLMEPRVTEEKPAWTRYEWTDELPEGRRERLEYAFDGFKSAVRRVVTAANGVVIHDDTFRSSYRRVIGHILVGRGPDDPRAGTIEEPGKPPDA